MAIEGVIHFSSWSLDLFVTDQFLNTKSPKTCQNRQELVQKLVQLVQNEFQIFSNDIEEMCITSPDPYSKVCPNLISNMFSASLGDPHYHSKNFPQATAIDVQNSPKYSKCFHNQTEAVQNVLFSEHSFIWQSFQWKLVIFEFLLKKSLTLKWKYMENLVFMSGHLLMYVFLIKPQTYAERTILWKH